MKSKVEQYRNAQQLAEGLAKAEEMGWVPVSHTHFVDEYRRDNFTVLFRTDDVQEAFSIRAITRLLEDGSPEEQEFASALLAQRVKLM